MSLATKLSEAVQTKILILDVERLPGITKQYWWDRGDLKNRYIAYEDVERMPRTTIVCAKWYHEAEVMAFCEWDKGGRKRFLKNVHALLSEASVVVGHFITGADLPWLANDLHIEGGLPPLPPLRTIDTYKVIRKAFGVGAPFKALDAMCKILNVPGKSDRYDRAAMERAVTDKSVEDRDRLVAYCKSDVVAAQLLLDKLLPHLPNPPTLVVDGKDPMTTCHRCGHDTEPIPRRFTAQMLTYSMRRCTHCLAYSRISIEPQRMSIVRSV